jgi:hypothetical protein
MKVSPKLLNKFLGVSAALWMIMILIICLLCLPLNFPSGTVVKYVNERKRLGENQQKIVDIQHSIEGCPPILEASRRFIREAQIYIYDASGQKHKRHVFLFNDLIVFVKHGSKKVKLQTLDLLYLTIEL